MTLAVLGADDVVCFPSGRVDIHVARAQALSPRQFQMSSPLPRKANDLGRGGLGATSIASPGALANGSKHHARGDTWPGVPHDPSDWAGSDALLRLAAVSSPGGSTPGSTKSEAPPQSELVWPNKMHASAVRHGNLQIGVPHLAPGSVDLTGARTPSLPIGGKSLGAGHQFVCTGDGVEPGFENAGSVLALKKQGKEESSKGTSTAGLPAKLPGYPSLTDIPAPIYTWSVSSTGELEQAPTLLSRGGWSCSFGRFLELLFYMNIHKDKPYGSLRKKDVDTTERFLAEVGSGAGAGAGAGEHRRASSVAERKSDNDALVYSDGTLRPERTSAREDGGLTTSTRYFGRGDLVIRVDYTPIVPFYFPQQRPIISNGEWEGEKRRTLLSQVSTPLKPILCSQHDCRGHGGNAPSYDRLSAWVNETPQCFCAEYECCGNPCASNTILRRNGKPLM